MTDHEGQPIAKPASCATCKLRARYDKNPRSLLGRFWRWHTRWCPGWKAYLAGLPAEERRMVEQRLRPGAGP